MTMIVYIYQDMDNGKLEAFNNFKDAVAHARANWPDEDEDSGDIYDGEWVLGEYVSIVMREVK